MNPRRSRAPWPFAAAALWSLLFAAPHTWWALGVPLGFPGGREAHQFMLGSSWRYAYLVVVTLLSFLGVVVAIVLAGGRSASTVTRLFIGLAWAAAGMLLLRGVAGMIADGRSDPVWWPTFMLGGVLFGLVAWRSRRQAARV